MHEPGTWSGEPPWCTAAERRRLERLCATITGEPAAAADLAQETMLQAWRIRDRLTDPAGARPWLDAVARHVCRRWRAARERMADHERTVPDPTAGDAGSAYDPLVGLLEREELLVLLERALAALPAPTREALVERYVEERSPSEIAARLGCTPDAVSMRLVRGRSRLRELLETDLVDDEAARPWVERHGVAWRRTRLVCADCGAAALEIRWDRSGGVVELRCGRCDPPDGISASYRLDNPELGPRLAGLVRPSAVVSRMATWSHGWWPGAIRAGGIACTRCGSWTQVTPYVRPGLTDARCARGWVAGCTACGEQLSTSLAGLALAHPEVRALRARRPRARSLPERTARYDGRAAVLVGYHDEASGESVSLAFDRETTRPLGVVAR